MTDKILVHVTCSSLGEATTIAESLVELRLAACVSIGTHQLAVYHWEGERRENTEYPLVIKTTAAKFDGVAAEVRRLHSYTCPEIIAVAISAGAPDYLQWIDSTLAAPPA